MDKEKSDRNGGHVANSSDKHKSGSKSSHKHAKHDTDASSSSKSNHHGVQHHDSRSKSAEKSSSKSKKHKTSDRHRDRSHEKTSSKCSDRHGDRSHEKDSSGSSRKSRSRDQADRSKSSSKPRSNDHDDNASVRLPEADKNRAVNPENSPTRSRHRSYHEVSPSPTGDQQESIRELTERIAFLENRRANTSPAFTFDCDEFLRAKNDFDECSRSSYDRSSRCAEEPDIDSRGSVHSDANDDFLKIMNEGTEGAQKGAPLSADALSFVSKLFEHELDPQAVKDIKERYLTPENGEMLTGKSINVEIYRQLEPNIKKRDFLTKGIQSSMATASIANIRLIEMLSTLRKQGEIKLDVAKSLLKFACDSTKVLSKGFSDLSVYRKGTLRPHVQPKYQQLCSKRTYGNMLFGDDLSKEVKAIDEESKIMRHFARSQTTGNFGHQQSFNQSHRYGQTSAYGHRYQPYSKNGQQRGRGSFRPQFNQYRGKKPNRGRGRPMAQPQNQSASQQ